MISSITLSTAAGGTVTLHSTAPGAKTVATRVEGFQGVAPVRSVVTDRAQADGAFVRSRYTTSRTLTVECEIVDSTVEAAMDVFDTIAGAIHNSVNNDRTLRWRRDTSGQQLEAAVRLADFQPVVFTGGAPFVTFQASFIASDPRVYDQTLVTATGAALATAAGGKTYTYAYNRTYNPSSGGTVSYTNAGSVPTPPIIRVYGYCSSPQVVLSGDTRLVFTGEVATGDYLEIDCAARTVRLNGTTSRLNLLDPVSSTFFELPVGSGTVQLLASNFNGNARADLLYRSAFT